jgi:hypothetical protein
MLTMKPDTPMSRFLMLSLLIAIPMDIVLQLIGHFGSDEALRNYTDAATVIPLVIVTILLLLVVKKAKDRAFRMTTTLITAGFGLQIAFFIVWVYYWHIVNRGGMPDVSIGDAFYLGSYVFWTAAAVPYIRRYASLMSGRSRAILAIYAIIAAVIVYVTISYWYNASQLYGYGWLATAVWLSYPVAATLCLFFMISVTLLYGYEGYGKGLLTNYWTYFLLPIILIACADLVNGFYYVLSENSVPGRLDDVLYLAGYAFAVAAGIAVLRSELEDVTVLPSVEKHMFKGGSVKVTLGRGHIVEDPKGDFTYELFSRLVAGADSGGKREGLILSRRAPATIREQFGLKDVTIVWISMLASENSVDPSKPNMMTHTIMEFLSRSKNGVVLFDGVESTMIYNDFGRAIKMLEQINDSVMQYRGYLLVPIIPKAFDLRERALLERSFETIAVPDIPVIGRNEALPDAKGN